MRVRVSMRAHSARQEILSGFVMNDGQSAVLDGSNNLSEVRLLRARRDEPGGPKQARPPPFGVRAMKLYWRRRHSNTPTIRQEYAYLRVFT